MEAITRVLTLMESLERAAAETPSAGVTYHAAQQASRHETYGELLARANRYLGGLRSRGLRAGDHVMLALDGNALFLPAFWACVGGGIIPSPMPSPKAARPGSETLDKLLGAWRVLGEPLVVVEAPIASGIPVDNQLLVSDLAAAEPALLVHVAKPDDTAFIQFSSGSTGRPKGVVLSHRNIMANLQAIAKGLSVTPGDASLNWMPLYHDLGLVGFHLAAVYCAISQHHLPTRRFIASPLAWFDCLQQTQATITASPNFGYSLLLDKLDAAGERTWDLSHVRVVLNGAEPISVDLARRFLRRVESFRLRPSAMFPVYGLAEATLAVAFPPLGQPMVVASLDREELSQGRAVATEPAAHSIEFAIEGRPVEGCEVRIADDKDEPLPEGTVGQIQIRGENVTAGYFANGETGQDLFCGGQWLRTGDMGFLAEGQLCVTGREKDILFLHGRNLYAHDLESAAQKVPGVSPGRVAVCAYREADDWRDRIALFLASPDLAGEVSTFLAVRALVQARFGVPIDKMVPLKAAQLPRTTSGKVQRFKLRERLEAGEYDERIGLLAQLVAERECEARVAPGTPTERLLHQLWCEQMQRAPGSVGIHDSWEQLGGTSLDLVGVLTAIEQRLSIWLHSSQVEAHPTIAELAGYIDKHALGLRSRERAYFRG